MTAPKFCVNACAHPADSSTRMLGLKSLRELIAWLTLPSPISASDRLNMRRVAVPGTTPADAAGRATGACSMWGRTGSARRGAPRPDWRRHWQQFRQGEHRRRPPRCAFCPEPSKAQSTSQGVLLVANAFASADVSAENDTTTTASNAIQRWVVRRKLIN